MKISEVIQIIKDHNYKEWNGNAIKPETTRDKVLYGDVDKECTGVVTTIYASVEVIRKAAKMGANLIVAHESLFWNHGDHTDWLQDNSTFKYKKALLDATGITVWRDHDHIHAGVDWEGERVDGIFYGLSAELGWLDYRIGNVNRPMMYEIPKTPTRDVAEYLMEKMNLNGIKTMGNVDGYTSRIFIPSHVIGPTDNQMLTIVEENNIDTIIAMEITDFTLAIFMRDGAMLGQDRCVLAAGHFNVEEPGMKWFGEVFLPTILPAELPIKFIQAGDSYTMLLRKNY